MTPHVIKNLEKKNYLNFLLLLPEYPQYVYPLFYYMLLANFHLHIFLKQVKNTHNSCPFVDYRDTLLEKITLI